MATKLEKEEHLRRQIEKILATQEIARGATESEGVEYTSEDMFGLFDKIMQPKKPYGVITKDVKTSNLDKTNSQKVIILKSIAKDFGVYTNAFELNRDVWINATTDSIDADAEVICAVSQGYLAKLLDTFVTAKKEAKVISEFKGEKKGLIFK